ncbi:phosphotransferase family protein, partial [Nocardia salmonicida]|uniref:phosphotransferase family protein n=1 Tax=Nocardia salmonicida TaxID=53431 RepID=UPI0033F6A7BE
MADIGVVGVDPSAIETWLRELGIAFTRPLTFERIGLGQSNLTYRVSDPDGRQWVLRRPPLGTLLASAHDVAREARILSALGDTAVPTPRVFGLTRDVDDVPLLLMELVDGLVVEGVPVADALALQRRRRIGLSMPKTLAKIHAVDFEAIGLSDLASHKPYAQRQIKRWSRQWELSKTRDVVELEELTQRLILGVPKRQELALVHGDFHLR